jgi:hypothetical protein
MEADMDAAENARMNGTTDIRTENKLFHITCFMFSYKKLA